MASKTLLPESRSYAKEAADALHRHGLYAGFQDGIKRETDSVELIEIRNTAPIDVQFKPSLVGHWSLHLSWTIRRVPRGDPILWRSSFGLKVRGTSFAPDEGAVCLVRYDVDNDRPGPGLDSLGAHLNILQPAPLHDHIHFPVLAGPEREWTVSEVIDVFLASEFVGELRELLANDTH